MCVQLVLVMGYMEAQLGVGVVSPGHAPMGYPHIWATVPEGLWYLPAVPLPFLSPILAGNIGLGCPTSQYSVYCFFLIKKHSFPRNISVRERSRGSCLVFPQHHTDKRRKHISLHFSEPPAPLIAIPKFSSGSSHCSFTLHLSCCLPFHPASTKQWAQTKSHHSSEEPLLVFSSEHSAPWHNDNQEKMVDAQKPGVCPLRSTAPSFSCNASGLWKLQPHCGCDMCCFLAAALGHEVGHQCRDWDMLITSLARYPEAPPAGTHYKAGSTQGIPLQSHCAWPVSADLCQQITGGQEKAAALMCRQLESLYPLPAAGPGGT